jgi:hypothetical protein
MVEATLIALCTYGVLGLEFWRHLDCGASMSLLERVILTFYSTPCLFVPSGVNRQLSCNATGLKRKLTCKMDHALSFLALLCN